MKDAEKKEKIRNTVEMLMQLDEKSLLIVESGAALLLTRQEMEGKKAG